MAPSLGLATTATRATVPAREAVPRTPLDEKRFASSRQRVARRRFFDVPRANVVGPKNVGLGAPE